MLQFGYLFLVINHFKALHTCFLCVEICHIANYVSNLGVKNRWDNARKFSKLLVKLYTRTAYIWQLSSLAEICEVMHSDLSPSNCANVLWILVIFWRKLRLIVSLTWQFQNYCRFGFGKYIVRLVYLCAWKENCSLQIYLFSLCSLPLP